MKKSTRPQLRCQTCKNLYPSPTGRNPVPAWHILAHQCPDCARSQTPSEPKPKTKPQRGGKKSKAKRKKVSK